MFNPALCFHATYSSGSRLARSQSILSASLKRSRSSLCRRSHTRASCQSWGRLQQVEPDPQPISVGSICQGMPLLGMHTMPVTRGAVRHSCSPAFRLRRQGWLYSFLQPVAHKLLSHNGTVY